MCSIGEARPRAPVLEMKPFHQDMFHGFFSIPGDRFCLMREYLPVVGADGIGISEVSEIFYFSIHGKIFQRRSHQLRVSRSVSFSLQVR